MKTPIIDLIVSLKYKCMLNEEQIREKTPLSPSEYHGILSISEDEQLSCNEFSGRMGLSPSRGSRVIEKLTKDGFITGKSVQGDRRRTALSLTPKGMNIRNSIQDMKNECENRIAHNLDPDAKEAVRNGLEKLISIL
jgi:DNA-binding MarR family transcriptional regulator